MIRTLIAKAIRAGNRTSEIAFLREAYRIAKVEKVAKNRTEGYCRDNHRAMMLFLRGKEE